MRFDEIISSLSKRLGTDAESDDVRAAAKLTGGVPVYADIGGILIVLTDGRVVHFDPDTHIVTPVTDTKWRRVALANAARKFPELATLLPARPTDARSCTVCGGTGVLLGANCGSCSGLGWVDS
jgi:hypothetical protein